MFGSEVTKALHTISEWCLDKSNGLEYVMVKYEHCSH